MVWHLKSLQSNGSITQIVSPTTIITVHHQFVTVYLKQCCFLSERPESHWSKISQRCLICFRSADCEGHIIFTFSYPSNHSGMARYVSPLTISGFSYFLSVFSDMSAQIYTKWPKSFFCTSRFPTVGPLPFQYDYESVHKAEVHKEMVFSTLLLWKSLTGLHRASTLFNTFGMNWN